MHSVMSLAQLSTCFAHAIHMQQNIKQKLIELHIPEMFGNHLLTSVCGKVHGDTLYEGLIDASTAEEIE